LRKTRTISIETTAIPSQIHGNVLCGEKQNREETVVNDVIDGYVYKDGQGQYPRPIDMKMPRRLQRRQNCCPRRRWTHAEESPEDLHLQFLSDISKPGHDPRKMLKISAQCMCNYRALVFPAPI
jgi:hypothetical protein